MPFGIRGADLVDVARRNVRVLFAEVVHHRAARRFVEVILDLPAVVRHGAEHRQLAGGDVGQRATPAIAHHRHATRVLDHVDAGGEIEKRLLLGNLQPVAAALLDFRFAVAELDAAADAIEQTRRDGHVAFGRETIGHASGCAGSRRRFPARPPRRRAPVRSGAASQALNSWPSRAMSVVNSPMRQLLELSGFDERTALCHQRGGGLLSRRYYSRRPL